MDKHGFLFQSHKANRSDGSYEPGYSPLPNLIPATRNFAPGSLQSANGTLRPIQFVDLCGMQVCSDHQCLVIRVHSRPFAVKCCNLEPVTCNSSPDGSSIQKWLPPPGAPSTPTLPPSRCIPCLTMANPIPVPGRPWVGCNVSNTPKIRSR